MRTDKMKAEFQRESEHHYLVIDFSSVQMGKFAVRILEENKIAHLCPVTCREMNAHLQLYYEISGLEVLTAVYDHMPMSGAMIRRLFNDMGTALREAERFFLDPEDILFDPAYIFADPINGEAFFCCLPGREDPEKADGLVLAEYILKHLDHADRDAVSIGYGFYREISRSDAVLINALRETTDPAIPVTRSSLRSLDSPDDPELWNSRIPMEETMRQSYAASVLSSPSGKEPGHPLQDDCDRSRPGQRQAKAAKPGRSGKLAVFLIPGSAAAAGILSFLSGADIAAAGALFALAGALDWLIINTVKNTKDAGHPPWADTQNNSEEEEEFIRSLLKE